MADRTNFQDVGDFHEKFDLPNVTHRGPGPNTHQLTPALLEFRMKFMLEELLEFAEACDYELVTSRNNSHAPGNQFIFSPIQEGVLPSVDDIDHEKAFDALLDLAYVVLGSAQVMGYPWQEGWDEVQRANITKERCTVNHAFVASAIDKEGEEDGTLICVECGQPKHKHSLRGSSNDVIKPKGWMPPSLKTILQRYGFKL